MSAPTLEALQARFGDAIVSRHDLHGDETALVDASRIREICFWLRDEPELAFDQLIDLTAVDTLGYDERESGRFEIVYHLRSIRHGHRLRLKAGIDEGESLVRLVYAEALSHRGAYDAARSVIGEARARLLARAWVESGG